MNYMARVNKLLDELTKSINEVYQNKEFEIEDLDFSLLNDLEDKLDMLSDLRQKWKIKYKLSHVLIIILLCSLSGINTFKDMSIFISAKKDFINKILNSKYERMPSEDLFADVLRMIDKEELIILLPELFIEFINKTCEKFGIDTENVYIDEENDIRITDVLNFDGKEIRNTGLNEITGKSGNDLKNFNSTNVFSTKYSIGIDMERIEAKENEITVMPDVIKRFNKNVRWVLTADALNTQTNVVDNVVDNNGYYCLIVKENQKETYKGIKEYFDDEVLFNEAKNGKNHYYYEESQTPYKIIKKEYIITNDISWFNELGKWKDLKWIGVKITTSINKKTNKVEVEKHYYISNLAINAELFHFVSRNHWNVEAMHWYLDVIFKEDDTRIRNKNILENFTIINRFIIGVLKLIRPTLYKNESYNTIRKKFGYDFKNQIIKLLSYFKTISNI